VESWVSACDGLLQKMMSVFTNSKLRVLLQVEDTLINLTSAEYMH
jgi:hypothetical protein